MYETFDFAGDDKLAERAGLLEMRFDVPPQEAIDYFRRKKVIPKKEFEELEAEAKAAAFTVGGIYEDDILQAFKDEIDNALTLGRAQKEVIGKFKDILGGAGHKQLGNFHLETVMRTNSAVAYSVGRRKQMEEVSEDLPIWEYSAVNDSRTRPTHRALDGLQFPANHAFWDTHFPPIDFNCRCTTFAVEDYRHDYNHEKPNPDTTIVYDDAGLPQKAEYNQQVVDLKATKFVGVPKQTGLAQTFEKVTKLQSSRSRSGKNKFINEDDDKIEQRLEKAAKQASAAKAAKQPAPITVPETVMSRFQELRTPKIEIAHVFDAQANWLGMAEGDAESVDIPEHLLEAATDGYVIHNHPPKGSRKFSSFSSDDIILAADWRIFQTLTVTQDYVYVLQVDDWDERLITKILASHRRNSDIIIPRMHEQVRKEKVTFNEGKDAENHLIWEKVAEELNLSYKRIKL